MPVITDSKELKKRVENLQKEKFVTIDTEFHREKTYFPHLCLLQVAGKNDAFVVDTLADGIDLTPVKKLLANPEIIKVLHACSQDLEIFLYEFGKLPKNVFDSQIAAQILGYGESIGYSYLVEQICHASVDKSSRHTDWAKRPLSKRQIDYALSDVTYLREIYKSLRGKLKKRDRTVWMEEEMEKVMIPSIYKNNPDEMWKKLKVGGIKNELLGVIRELTKWRELRAMEVNKPRFWILKNDAIIELASVRPKSLKDLKGLRFYSQNNEEIGNELLEAVKRGLENPPPRVKRDKALPKSRGAMLDLLKVLLKRQSEIHKVAPSVIAKVDDIEKIVIFKKPDIPAMHGWRYDVFGKYAMELKEGKLMMACENNEVKLIERK